MGLARLERSVLAALWLLLVAVVSLNSLGVPTTDIKPEVYLAPARATAGFLSAWQSDPYLGSPSFNVGLAPVTAVLSVLAWAGLSPEAIFKVFRIVLLTVGAWGARRLYRQLAGEQGGAAGAAGRIAVAVAYVANPYVVVAGSTLPIAAAVRLLPWQTYALVRALEAPRGWRWPALFALAFAAMTGVNAGVVPLMQLVTVPAVLVVVPGAARGDLAARRGGRPALRPALRRALALLAGAGPVRAGRWVDRRRELGERRRHRRSVLGRRGHARTRPVADVRVRCRRAVAAGVHVVPHEPHRGPGVASCCPLLALASRSGPLRPGPRRRPSACWWWRCRSWSGSSAAGPLAVRGGAALGLRRRCPRLGAFRTTNKVGAVLVLGLALLVAAGSVALARRLSRDRRPWSPSRRSAVVLVGGDRTRPSPATSTPARSTSRLLAGGRGGPRPRTGRRAGVDGSRPGRRRATGGASRGRTTSATRCSTGPPWCGRSSR